MEKLIVPVYLNQRLVFDLLAMLQGGISTVTAISSTEANTSSRSEKVKASFGLSDALSSLLKIDLSGEKESGKSDAQGQSVSEERIHTPASLLYRLRNSLLEKKQLILLEAETKPISGDFIEFEASLSRNPIVETIDSISEVMKMVVLFEGSNSPPQRSNGKPTKQTENQKFQLRLDAFSEALKSGNTIDLTTSRLKSNHEAVITLESQFLNDPMMSDLVDGKFHVLGKVIRSFEAGSESISLIRKTALSKMPQSVFQDALQAFSALGSEHGFNVPELRWEIKGPAIQVLPIAIYA